MNSYMSKFPSYCLNHKWLISFNIYKEKVTSRPDVQVLLHLELTLLFLTFLHISTYQILKFFQNFQENKLFFQLIIICVHLDCKFLDNWNKFKVIIFFNFYKKFYYHNEEANIFFQYKIQPNNHQYFFSRPSFSHFNQLYINLFKFNVQLEFFIF